MIDCEYYVPAWEGSKTSNPQPDFCLKYRVVLWGKCVKSCKEQNKQSLEEFGMQVKKAGEGKC